MKRYGLKHARDLFAGFAAAFLLYVCCMPCTSILAAPLPPRPPSIIDIMDISDDFTDANFRQAVWQWLGKSGEPGVITEQDILDRLPVAGYKLDVKDCDISSLAGLEYFSGLKTLYCYENQLTELPPLPDTLTALSCSLNQLSRLPSLPAGLETLGCYGNNITALPSLPGALQMLFCWNNELSSLPELPTGLRQLKCDMNQLTELSDLPGGLTQLICSRNELSSLPSLPATLERLECHMNQLTTLPDLPDSINLIHCQYNQLTSLPPLPRNLRELDCSVNQLTSLPGLPTGIEILNCSTNSLSRLPALPEGLQNLSCSANALTSLPSLPGGLDVLECDNNILTELRDVPARMDRLLCQYNYLDILALGSELEPRITSHYVLGPQLKLHYIGSGVELSAGDTVKLGNVLKIQACTVDTDGLTWSNWENADISDLTFLSSDTETARIDSEGNITGISKGTCTIFAALHGLNTEATKTAVTVNVLEGEEITGPSSGGEGPGPETAIDYSSASEWAVEELREAAGYGLVTDKVKGSLKQDITREEFCSIAVKLYEALSSEDTAPVIYNPFTDTSDPDVLKAYKAGIVKGVSADRFAPNNKITRQEICVMIYRAIRAAKPGLDYDTTEVAPFADQDQIADWAIQEVRFASKNNIMKGTGANHISPLDNTSREQGIVLIKRTYETLRDK